MSIRAYLNAARLKSGQTKARKVVSHSDGTVYPDILNVSIADHQTPWPYINVPEHVVRTTGLPDDISVEVDKYTLSESIFVELPKALRLAGIYRSGSAVIEVTTKAQAIGYSLDGEARVLQELLDLRLKIITGDILPEIRYCEVQTS